MSDLEERVERGFSTLQAQVAQVELSLAARMEAVEKRVGGMEEKVGVQNGRVGKLEKAWADFRNGLNWIDKAVVRMTMVGGFGFGLVQLIRSL